MADSSRHYRERKNSKQNKKHPTVGFRCPSPAYKKRLVGLAKAEGITVQEYVLRAVSQYMAHPQDESQPASTPAKKRSKPLLASDELDEALKLFDL